MDHSSNASNLSDDATTDVLNVLLENSKFYLTARREIKTKGSQQSYYLGNITVTLSAPHGLSIGDGPSLCDEYYVYINPEQNKHMVYYEFFENDENLSSSSQKKVLYYLAKTDFPFKCFECLKVSCISTAIIEMTLNSKFLECRINFSLSVELNI